MRRALVVWSLAAMIGISVGHAHGAATDSIIVRIRIEDEVGKPIPHVTVWGFVDPYAPAEAGLQLRLADLWRFTTRYADSFEFVHHFNSPVPTLLIPVMGDADGNVDDAIDYEILLGKGQRRPDVVTFGYTFMKRSYRPERIEFTVRKPQSRVDAKLTLRRDPGAPLEQQPYLDAYDRIRHDLSDRRKNAEMTADNARRLERLRDGLEAAARQAVAHGDKPAAARIYARMQWMPELIVSDGRIGGFKQKNPASTANLAALKQAYELDPNSTYIRMETVKAGLLSTIPAEDRRGSALERIGLIEALIAAKGERVWPEVYLVRSLLYAELDMYERAYKSMKEAEQLEPRFIDYAKRIAKLKATMTRKGVPIPSTWD
jgi:tetratricopeptide (TPR) repeat protein